MTDAVDPSDVAGSAAAGRRALEDVLASPAVPSAHHLRRRPRAHRLRLALARARERS